MNQVMALVKNSFKDTSLISKIGTKVNIIAEARRYDGTFTKEDL